MGHGFRLQQRAWIVAALAAALAGPAALAIEFTQNTLIAANDPTYDGQDIIVTGCTVTINGYHPFNSLLIRGNGVVTHSANNDAHVHFMDLEIATFVTIEPGSRLDVSGRGYAPAKGPGAGLSAGYGSGAGHAGHGGRELNGSAGGAPYGQIAQPIDLGSGGGHPSGAAGGGAVRLTVAGTLQVGGTIAANGSNASNGGGGSGGSLWIDTGALTGNGTISAGGGRSTNNAGSGAGGRIALYYDSSTFSGTISAFAGNHHNLGGAGTIYTKASGAALANLLVDAGGLAGAGTPVHSLPANVTITNAASAYVTQAVTFDGNLRVANGCLLTHLANQARLDLTVLGDVTVDAGAAITADGKGFPPQAGPGVGASSGYGSGAGHGGHGGRENNGAAGGTTYGSITEPTAFGSGGGHPTGSAGGGAIHMTVAGTLEVNGTLSANGSNASSGGGGAGGSVWINAGTLAGNGVISTNGGNSSNYAGAGAGGRVAIYYDTDSFTGTKSARTGTNYYKGGAGTIYSKASGEPLAKLVVDNAGNDGAGTPIVSLNADVEILNRAWAYPQGGLTFQGDVDIGPNATLTHLANQDPLLLTVQGDVTIDAGGAIIADGKGFPAQAGPGVGASSGYGSGAGHGGHGGSENNGAVGGTTYGSITEPTAFGSGGGHSTGSAGGGAIQMTVAGTLEVNGTLSANGSNASSGGGGSGGSVWINAGTLAGNGAISANGGNASNYAGAGAGGRVAIYYGTDSFTGTKSARTGTNYYKGGAGTIYSKASGGPLATLVVDNGGYDGAGTPLTSLAASVRVVNRAWTYPQGNLAFQGDVYVGPYSSMTHLPAQDPLVMTVQGNVKIDADAAITADGKGHPPTSGPGAGASAGHGSGAGHGGHGAGEHNGTAGGTPYGSITEPTAFGSGGGHNTGGAGGGAVRMTIGGTLEVNGTLSANGGNASNGGGGSGGSLWIDTGVLAGNGVISTNGGNSSNYAGAGAGGRIAIYYGTDNFAGTRSARTGADYYKGGAGTIYTKAGSEPLSVLLVDNGTYAGAGTPLDAADGHVTIANGAWVYPAQTPVPIAGNLRVAPGGQLTHLNGQDGLRVAVTGHATIEPGGTVNVDAKGFAPGSGPGAGKSQGYGSGAGHGGAGGREHQGAAGGPVYGSPNEPTELGSGGGHSGGGGAGGGAIEMIVTGTLTIDGELSADGGYGSNGGGGSGGSVLLDVGTLLGAGTITADGGNSRTYSGAGGGGRIAIYTCDWQMNPAQITVNPGTTYYAGQPGTIFHGSPFITVTQHPAAQLVFFGSPVTFHVEASTTHGTLHYQWRKDDVNLENTGHYTGVLAHTLNIDAANYDDNGYYDVWLTDDCGNYISDKARLIVPRPGDLNCDGEEDFADINPFVLALTNPASYVQKYPHCRLLQGDCNGDGLVDFADINPFVRILTGP